MDNTFNEVLGQNKKCNYTLDVSEMNFIPFEAQELLQRMLIKNASERITAQQAFQSDFFKKPSSLIQEKKNILFKYNQNSKHLMYIILETEIFFQPATVGLQSEAESPFQRISQKCKNLIYFDLNIQENKCSSIQIRQLPAVKQPSCVRIEDPTIWSSYAKDPFIKQFYKHKRNIPKIIK